MKLTLRQTLKKALELGLTEIRYYSSSNMLIKELQLSLKGKKAEYNKDYSLTSGFKDGEYHVTVSNKRTGNGITWFNLY